MKKKIIGSLLITIILIAVATMPVFGSVQDSNSTANTVNYLVGDVNGDSSIDMKDVLLIRKYIAGFAVTFATVTPTSAPTIEEPSSTEENTTSVSNQTTIFSETTTSGSPTTTSIEITTTKPTTTTVTSATTTTVIPTTTTMKPTTTTEKIVTTTTVTIETKVPLVGTNLIVNGNFENGSTGWTFDNNLSGSAIENGQLVLRQVHAVSTNVISSFTTSILPNTMYTISADIFSDAPGVVVQLTGLDGTFSQTNLPCSQLPYTFTTGDDVSTFKATVHVESNQNAGYSEVIVDNMTMVLGNGSELPTTTTTKNTTTTSQPTPSVQDFPLINYISNASGEDTGTVENGEVFSITQFQNWNVWVLNYNEGLVQYISSISGDVYLQYDMTITGDGHLCVDGWNNSIAAAIAEKAHVGTTAAEDGTPMLVQGTYQGSIKVDPSIFGTTGRLGIVGTGAVIREFKLTGTASSDPSSRTTTKNSGIVTTTKSAPTMANDEPVLNIVTSEKYGSLGVWWWDATTITNQTTRTKYLDFLQSNHTTEIYLCVGSQTNQQLADFIKDAGSRGMRVSWLAGDSQWASQGNSGFDGMFNKFKTYQDQAANNEKFYGMHLDVEPYTAGIPWDEYYAFVIRSSNMIHNSGYLVEYDIPFWLDDTTITKNGSSVPILPEIADAADTLALMSYRDTADSVLSAGMTETALGTAHNCKIILGFEANYTAEGSNLSFAEEGKTVMYGVVKNVLESMGEIGTLNSGYGCAIHYIESWYNLKK